MSMRDKPLISTYFHGECYVFLFVDTHGVGCRHLSYFTSLACALIYNTRSLSPKCKPRVLRDDGEQVQYEDDTHVLKPSSRGVETFTSWKIVGLTIANYDSCNLTSGYVKSNQRLLSQKFVR